MSYVAVVTEALASRGHEVHVLACERGAVTADYRQHGVFVHRRPGIEVKLGSSLLPLTTNRLFQIVAHLVEHERLGGGFDLIESPDFRCSGLLLASKQVCPVVVRLHSPLSVEAPSRPLLDPLDLLISDALERAVVRQATALTAATRWLPEQLRERGWLDDRPVRVIRNPTDLRRWERSRPVETTDPVVVVLGRLEFRKAPEILVRAAALLGVSVPRLRVIIVGRSNGRVHGVPYGDWLRSHAAELQVDCQVIDEVPAADLPGIYEQARVVAVPSWQEGFSNVAIEAMASGRPVVCTSNTGVAELISGSPAGTVVPPGDVAALARALEPYLLSVERAAEAGSAGRAIVHAECDPAVIAEQVEDCYHDAVNHGPGPGLSR